MFVTGVRAATADGAVPLSTISLAAVLHGSAVFLAMVVAAAVVHYG